MQALFPVLRRALRLIKKDKMRGLRLLRRAAIPFSLIALSLFCISLVIYLICVSSTSAADFFNSTVGHALRATLGSIMRIFPFSVFEILVLLSPLIFLVLILLALRFGREVWGRVRVIGVFIAVISLIASSYIFTLGIAYRTTPTAYHLGLNAGKTPTHAELVNTFITLRDNANSLAEELGSGDCTSMRLSYAELSAVLSESYRTLAAEYPEIKTYNTRMKPVIFSTVMSDAGITGIYSFFTGEANVNVEYPDYTVPFTAAHEFAHARGIAREEEANFLAFLVCIRSSDPYVQYSGYLSMYEYLASALYSLDKELYLELKAGLSDTARGDILLSHAVTEKHKQSLLGRINERLNDLYLKSNGQAGVVSYSYVVRLCTDYYNR